MPTLLKNNLFLKLSAIVIVALLVTTYGCNNGTTTEVKKDTIVTPVIVDTVKVMDSTMKMKADTSGKGGQAVPPKH